MTFWKFLHHGGASGRNVPVYFSNWIQIGTLECFSCYHAEGELLKKNIWWEKFGDTVQHRGLKIVLFWKCLKSSLSTQEELRILHD